MDVVDTDMISLPTNSEIDVLALIKDWSGVKMVELIGKRLRLQLVGKVTCEGWCYTVDPETKSVAVVTLEDQCLNVLWVTGPSILSAYLTECSSPCPIDLRDPNCILEALTRKPGTFLAGASREHRKRLVLGHLQKHQLPATVSPHNDIDIVIMNGVLTIAPPYVPASCRSSNPTVLERIRKLLADVPDS